MAAPTRTDLLRENIALRERLDDIVDILMDAALEDTDKLERIAELADLDEGDSSSEATDELED